jgi:hypothetical protein
MEMLVAIAILALVLAALPGAFRLAHRTWDATAVLDRQARQEGAHRFVRARLAEAMPLFEQSTTGLVHLLFSGTSDAVSFVAPSANGPQGAGLYRFTLQARARGAGSALIATVAPYTPAGAAGEDASEEHVLLEDIGGVRLRYFGSGGLRQAPAWQEQWPRRDALPQAVELSIIGSGSVRTLLIPLRLRNAS